MLNQLPQINPLHTTSWQTLDFGDVESPDGRAHPVTATTPVSVVANNQPADATPVQQTAFGLPSFPSVPKHLGARLAISVLAIGILLIVAFRLAK